MCTDCGCSIRGMEEHVGEHSHDGGKTFHSHENNTEDNSNSHSHQQAHENLHHNPQLNDSKTISVIQKILDKNDQEANHNRKHLEENKILGVNLMSSPGSGKTTLLEYLSDVATFKFGVIEGDLETERDANRLRAKGIHAEQIQTGTACHLDAFMVHKGLHHMPLEDIDICFVENVGNLVCPASYDVGTHLNIVLVSVPEGEDKIAKYPVMFRQADLVLITKTDLLPHFKYDIEAEKAEARKLKPSVDILEVNVNDLDSVKAVANWIEFKRKMRA
ncbi:hydrogenase nickel incorporation protein HypB [Poseidonibacter lekithochrous]|uniref:hydrogenase nickel incorporation protein HypB n=1 Tax=Poseidonibacter TaxID=2321187 RepID=UPI001C08ABC5|nr:MULTISPECIES: hydrogenase nickel incorporation protein HypB [Poseidonibacter]MBU3013929.1 hydrogenase nickel incorporation protein HypB [Poseidonibacter lekithochrous]MDO6827224.1 hydrogenase nickel incorporation protein HypB [Poseidonibacter sp. 1_MG-2023]